MLNAFTSAPDGVRTLSAPHINDVSRRRRVLGGSAPPLIFAVAEAFDGHIETLDLSDS